MIPIDFILNFQVSASRAMQGISKMSASMENLAASSEMVQKGYSDWFDKMLPAGFQKAAENLSGVGIALEKTFNTETLKEFGKYTNKVSEEFLAMQADVQMKEFSKGFDMLTDRLKFMVPYLEQSADGFAAMYKSMFDLRKASPDSFKALSKNFEKMGEVYEKLKPAKQKAMQELFDTFGKSGKSVKDLKKLEVGLDGIIKKQEGIDKLKSSFADLFGFLPDGANTLRQIAIAAGAFSVFSDATAAQEQMVTSITQLGLATNNLEDDMFAMYKPTVKLTDAVLTLGAKTSVSMKEATEAMTTLLNMRVTNNISELEKLGETSIKMGQAFGMSNQEAAQFIKSLYKIGGLSSTQVKDAADTMANVQHQLGLTAAEASGVAAQVGSMARTMKVFGGRISDIKKLTQGVAKLSVAFEKSGLSASEANEMLTKMLDPEKLEENILLYQGLGMSASDAIGMMMGDTTKLNDMDERMVKLAKQLKAQYGGNVFALKEMAKQYGMTLEQVQSLSQLTSADLAMKKDEAKLDEQANKARASMNKEIQKLFNQLNVIMQMFVLPLVNILTAVLGFIVRALVAFTSWLAPLREAEGFVGGLAKFLSGLLGAGLIIFFLGLGKSIAGLFPMLGKLGGLIGNLKDGLAGVAGKAKDAIKNLLHLKKVEPKDVSSKIGGGTKKNIGGGKDIKGSGGLEKAVKALSKVKPAQLLALGAAIFFIAAGVALIALSTSVLAKSMAELDLKQIVGLIVVMAVILGGMALIVWLLVPAIAALGIAGTAGAIGLIAFGLAIFLIAAGIALIVLSVALLIHVLANSVGALGQLGGVVGLLIPFFLALAAGIGLVAGSMILMGVAALPAVAGLLAISGMTLMMTLMIPTVSKLGEAFFNMGMGIKNMADYGVLAAQNLSTLKDSMNNIGGGFAKDFANQLSEINNQLAKITLGSMVMSIGASLLGANKQQPESDNVSSSITANTDRITALIGESNKYLATIMDNTDKLVKILSEPQKESSKKEVYSKTYKQNSLMSKEA